MNGEAGTRARLERATVEVNDGDVPGSRFAGQWASRWSPPSRLTMPVVGGRCCYCTNINPACARNVQGCRAHDIQNAAVSFTHIDIALVGCRVDRVECAPRQSGHGVQAVDGSPAVN